MSRYTSIWVTFILLAPASGLHAQHLRGEMALTTERQGASINIDAYYQSRKKIFALARVFVDEPDGHSEAAKRANPFAVEAVAGRLFYRGRFVIGPLAGIDSRKRPLAGASFATKLRGHAMAYLGYVKVAARSEYGAGSRHRAMFDLRKDGSVFLRMDWKTEAGKHEHFRLGAELHRRIDKLNLPVYLEPFWNFTDRRIGVRVGTRL